MSVTDELLPNNERYAAGLRQGRSAAAARQEGRGRGLHGRPPEPATSMLGLEEGDAHVIRNAGGVVTDDEIRSLAISQRLLGTEEIILIHHTDCGMLTFNDDDFRQQHPGGDRHQARTWSAEAFSDLDEDVRQSIARIKASPFIPHKDSVRGFVYDVDTGRLREVT